MNSTCLVIVKKGNFLLFIKKKRGLGKGYITFPGGKIEKDEKAEECAYRETFEELGIRILEPKLVALIDFYLDSKLEEKMYVYLTEKFEGIPSETEEALPMWLNFIPYDEMWADDKYWLPLVLEGKKVCCYFIFSENWKELKDGECKSCELT